MPLSRSTIYSVTNTVTYRSSGLLPVTTTGGIQVLDPWMLESWTLREAIQTALLGWRAFLQLKYILPFRALTNMSEDLLTE